MSSFGTKTSSGRTAFSIGGRGQLPGGRGGGGGVGGAGDGGGGLSYQHMWPRDYIQDLQQNLALRWVSFVFFGVCVLFGLSECLGDVHRVLSLPQVQAISASDAWTQTASVVVRIERPQRPFRPSRPGHGIGEIETQLSTKLRAASTSNLLACCVLTRVSICVYCVSVQCEWSARQFKFLCQGRDGVLRGAGAGGKNRVGSRGIRVEGLLARCRRCRQGGVLL